MVNLLVTVSRRSMSRSSFSSCSWSMLIRRLNTSIFSVNDMTGLPRGAIKGFVEPGYGLYFSFSVAEPA